MCRFIAYIGHPVLLDYVLIKPVNSLINQSIHAREADEPLNGDGFGLGWYDHNIDRNPGLFKSITPAWNNSNLMHLASKIRSTCFFAHIRAATIGSVSENNTHPFNYENFLFMHNGGIGDFKIVKRHLRRQLSDNIYEWLKGETDTEHFFALYLQLLQARKIDQISAQLIFDVLQEAIDALRGLKRQLNLESDDFLNTVITNGHFIVASRYVSNHAKMARTLYYSAGREFIHKNNVCHMESGHEKNQAILVVSEKLNDIKTDWHLIPQNHGIIVEKSLDIEIKELL